MRDSGAVIAGLRADPAFAPLYRSLDVYYGDRAQQRAMDRLYGRFVKRGDLAFDIGSHVGDRIGSFRRLGGRGLALEPPPPCARAVPALYPRAPGGPVRERGFAERPRPVTPGP